MERVVLPFQTIEMINESRATRKKEKRRVPMAHLIERRKELKRRRKRREERLRE
ncbi:MAG TPA: hypothetical protein VJZ49_08330 [Syntrophales bacterium]|nr:hypothetical protein [Syntrophales bacterium]